MTALLPLQERGAVFVAFVPAGFDLAENVGFVVLVTNPPTEMTALIYITAFSDTCKMQSINIIFIGSSLLALITVLAVLNRRNFRGEQR
ncbi:MAG: hypothetical protein P8L79_02745 [Rhodospirillaceae bacterium]|jgi:hypothetical protein|nr:hypothetical protein [Rhodospirillaceae bacterium]